VKIASYNSHLGLLRSESVRWIPHSLLEPFGGRLRYVISYPPGPNYFPVRHVLSVTRRCLLLEGIPKIVQPGAGPLLNP
jgi:hypothetical protein